MASEQAAALQSIVTAAAHPLHGATACHVWMFASGVKALAGSASGILALPASALTGKIKQKGGAAALQFIASIAAGETRVDFAPESTVGVVIDALMEWSKAAAPPVQALIKALLPAGERFSMPHYTSDAGAFVAAVTQALYLLYAVARPPTPNDMAHADLAFAGLWGPSLEAFLNSHAANRWGVPLRADELLRLCRVASQPESSLPASEVFALSSQAPCEIALQQALEDSPDRFYAAFGLPLRKPKGAPPFVPFTVDLGDVLERASSVAAYPPVGPTGVMLPPPAAAAAAAADPTAAAAAAPANSGAPGSTRAPTAPPPGMPPLGAALAASQGMGGPGASGGASAGDRLLQAALDPVSARRSSWPRSVPQPPHISQSSRAAAGSPPASPILLASSGLTESLMRLGGVTDHDAGGPTTFSAADDVAVAPASAASAAAATALSAGSAGGGGGAWARAVGGLGGGSAPVLAAPPITADPAVVYAAPLEGGEPGTTRPAAAAAAAAAPPMSMSSARDPEPASARSAAAPASASVKPSSAATGGAAPARPPPVVKASADRLPAFCLDYLKSTDNCALGGGIGEGHDGLVHPDTRVLASFRDVMFRHPGACNLYAMAGAQACPNNRACRRPHPAALEGTEPPWQRLVRMDPAAAAAAIAAAGSPLKGAGDASEAAASATDADSAATAAGALVMRQGGVCMKFLRGACEFPGTHQGRLHCDERARDEVQAVMRALPADACIAFAFGGYESCSAGASCVRPHYQPPPSYGPETIKSRYDRLAHLQAGGAAPPPGKPYPSSYPLGAAAAGAPGSAGPGGPGPRFAGPYVGKVPRSARPLISPSGMPRFCLHQLFGICMHSVSHGTYHVDAATLADFNVVRRNFTNACCFFVMGGKEGCAVSSDPAATGPCPFPHPAELQRVVATPWDRCVKRAGGAAALMQAFQQQQLLQQPADYRAQPAPYVAAGLPARGPPASWQQRGPVPPGTGAMPSPRGAVVAGPELRAAPPAGGPVGASYVTPSPRAPEPPAPAAPRKPTPPAFDAMAFFRTCAPDHCDLPHVHPDAGFYEELRSLRLRAPTGACIFHMAGGCSGTGRDTPGAAEGCGGTHPPLPSGPAAPPSIWERFQARWLDAQTQWQDVTAKGRRR